MKEEIKKKEKESEKYLVCVKKHCIVHIPHYPQQEYKGMMCRPYCVIGANEIISIIPAKLSWKIPQQIHVAEELRTVPVLVFAFPVLSPATSLGKPNQTKQRSDQKCVSCVSSCFEVLGVTRAGLNVQWTTVLEICSQIKGNAASLYSLLVEL